jgi:hypothetical protein
MSVYTTDFPHSCNASDLPLHTKVSGECTVQNYTSKKSLFGADMLGISQIPMATSGKLFGIQI